MNQPRYAVIGDPIGHSLSPVMQNTFFACMDQPGEMVPIHVKKGEVPAFFSSLEEEGIRGFNVTMPHKEAAMLCCDELDDVARLTRSVNCVVRTEEKHAVGYNTDAEGLRLAVEREGFSYEGQDILILGAGAVTRPIAYTMAQTARSITFANRTQSAAEEAADFLKEHTECVTFSCDFSTEVLSAAASESTMLINATPLGMQGVDAQFEDLSFLDALTENAPVIDLIYRPACTAFLAYAKEKNHPVMNGLTMLLMQGALSFRHFTGVMPDEGALKAAYEILKNA